MTPAEFKNLVVNKLSDKRRGELTWAQFANVVQGFDAVEREQIVKAFQRGRGEQAGDFIQKRIDVAVRAAAVTEADNILADATLTQAEFLRIFGND
jgi:hypothetical protein